MRSVVVLAIACSAAGGCGRDAGIVEVSDAAFVETGGGGSRRIDSATLDASELGCAVLSPFVCGVRSVCCVVGERCIPSVDGPNRCVAAGALLAAEPCGFAGEDDCGEGLICAGWAGGDSRGVCRRLCDPSIPSCSEGVCEVALEIRGEVIGLCR